jgi:arginyl-tRNA synthetase
MGGGTEGAARNGVAGAAPAGSGPVEHLRDALTAAAASVRGGDRDVPRATLERPPRPEFGDYSTNAAMMLAPALNASPREIAERLGEELRSSMGVQLARVEVAGPGFLNVFLSDRWFCSALERIREEGERLGRDVVPSEKRERMLVEFVSANPTGPLTVAGGRHAAFGDSLCRVLAFAGHEIEREFYVNDQGTQVELFGRSIVAAMTGQAAPEGGYRGEYIKELAQRISAEGLDPSALDTVTRRGLVLVLDQVRSTLERFRVRFDRFFSERELAERSRVEQTLEQLQEHGHVYSSEGATWLRTTAFGDDKDRVLRRSSEELTYFAWDIAYHEDKRRRGFERLIDVLGADHHGYVERIKAAFAALGGDRERLEPIIMQLVHVIERGERAQMSKRKGEFVTLDDLIDDIGVDAARFFMLQRSHDTALDIDLDLAREQSQENPVYYVQYAHARIASILRNAGTKRLEEAKRSDLTAADLKLEPAERALVKRLLELPEEVREAAARRAPHRLTTYGHEVAADFHAFYRDCRVVGAEPRELEDLRLCLCLACQQVIARTLDLLGVEAPERM